MTEENVAVPTALLTNAIAITKDAGKVRLAVELARYLPKPDPDAEAREVWRALAAWHECKPDSTTRAIAIIRSKLDAVRAEKPGWSPRACPHGSLGPCSVCGDLA